jgi:FlaG/FlaF family flagellin (archaellin)
MSPGTPFHLFHRNVHGESSSTAWAAIIAILFALVAAISFAVDQSVTLSSLPAPPQAHAVGR